MKSITLSLTIGLSSLQFAHAQKISITQNTESSENGNSPSMQVFIPHATAKAAEKAWKDFLKDHHAKVKSSKDEINTQNFVLKAGDTMQVYSRISESSEGATLNAAFSSSGAFVTSTSLQSDYENLNHLLHDYALPIAKDALDKKIATANEILDDKTKERDNLLKRNEHLHDANDKMKSEISDNEREMSDNEGKIGSLKTVVEQQRNAVDDIKKKLKDLE